MTSTGLYNFRLNLKPRQPHNAIPALPPTGDSVDGATADDAANADADAFALLVSLRGVQPERLRAVFTGTASTGGHGLSLRLAFADLPNKLLRR